MDPFKPLVAFAYCASVCVCVCEMRKQKWKIIPNSIANEIEGERPHKYTHIHTVAHTKSIQSIPPPKNAPKTESAPQKGRNRRFTQFGRFKSKIRSRQSEKQKIQHNWISNTKYSRQKKKRSSQTHTVATKTFDTLEGQKVYKWECGIKCAAVPQIKAASINLCSFKRNIIQYLRF